MKILLINPSGSAESEYGSLAKAATKLPQLGLASIAACLIDKGHKVRIIDYNLERLTLDILMKIIKDGEYQMAGFSVYITSERTAFKLSENIKRSLPNIKICVGGPQVTLWPQNFFKPCIDYVFIGEAEHSIIELLNHLERETIEAPNIKGVLYRAAEQFKGNSELRLVDELDSLPFIELDSLYDLSLYYPPVHVRGKKIINLISGRGCPFNCTFCAASAINGRRIRCISAKRFVDYLEFYVKKGYDSFIIYDDIFTINRHRAVEISKEIIRRKLKILWASWSRVDQVEPQMLSIMRDAGCYLINFGCESMNDKTLLRIKKGVTVEQNLKGIEETKKAGLMVFSSFMLGLPGESKVDMLNTIKIVNKTRIDFVIYPIFEPYKGTPIYEECEKEGHWIKVECNNDLLEDEDQDKIWEPYAVSRKELEKLSHYGFNSFYFRPSFLLNIVKIFRNLPMRRKIRFIQSGIDYVLSDKIRFRSYTSRAGTRF